MKQSEIGKTKNDWGETITVGEKNNNNNNNPDTNNNNPFPLRIQPLVIIKKYILSRTMFTNSFI
jgi:hypothetical protein